MKTGSNVLVVVDDAHVSKVSPIFNVIENIKTLNAKDRGKIQFLLAARIPDFDWVIENNIWGDLK